MRDVDDSVHLKKYQVVTSGICALIITVGLARFAYTPLLPIMNREAGLSLLAGGWLATFNYIGYIAGALIAASLSDLDIKFKLYKIFLLLSICSTAAMGATTDVVIWSVLRFVSGLTSIAGMLIASGLILNWLMRKGQAPELGLHFTGVGMGIVVSGLAIVSMLNYFNWSEQWYWLAILGMVFFPPAWLWMPKPKKLSSHNSTQQDTEKKSKNWMRLLIAFYFCTGFGYAIGATFIVAILVQMEYFANIGSVIWIIVGAAAMPSSFLWDKIARSTNTVFALILANALETVAILVPIMTDSPELNIVGAVLFGSTFVGIVSLTLALVGQSYPSNPAKAMAKLTISYGIAQIVAPAAAGYLAAKHGSYSDSLLLTAMALTAGTVLLFFLYLCEKIRFIIYKKRPLLRNGNRPACNILRYYLE